MNLNTIQIILLHSLLLSYPWAIQSFSIHPSTPALYSFKTVTTTTSSTSSTGRTTKPLQLASSHQELLDAEEAAALDAHDVSDAGLEAAMMEAAVMTADEIFRSQHQKKESPTKTLNQPTSQATSSELPYEDFVERKFHFEKDFMESRSTNDVDEGHTVIESLANLIKDVDE